MQTTSLVTTKGQVTIPKYYRDSLGIEVGTTVEFLFSPEQNFNQVILKPIKPFSSFSNTFKSKPYFAKNKLVYSKRLARKLFTKALLEKEI